MPLFEHVHVLPQSPFQVILMSRLRDMVTSAAQFREATLHLGRMLAHQAVGETHVTTIFPVHTPLEDVQGYEFVGSSSLVPILRAGLALEGPFRGIRSGRWRIRRSVSLALSTSFRA